MRAKYQIVLSNAVVGVDRPMKALSKHLPKLIREKCLSSHICHFVKIHFLTKLLHAYFQCVYIVKTKYQITGTKAVVGVDQPMKALSMHIQKRIRGKLS